MAIVFDIQRFCTNDGPGIRTTVFIKGCPLHCVWCHNPESQSTCREILFDPSKCTLCGRCQAACENNGHIIAESHSICRENCVGCGKCAETCFNDAIKFAGKEMSVDEVIEEVKRDAVFYKNSGGGMTLSGGEPLYNFRFAIELLKAAKAEGLHTCIETSGCVSRDKILAAAEYTDLFLFDWKISDPRLHKKYVGIDNALIEENLAALSHSGASIILRCPIIPGINDNDEHFAKIASLANDVEAVLRVDIEPYHSLGVGKYIRLGEKSDGHTFLEPSSEQVEEWVAKLSSLTQKPIKKA